MTVMKDYIVFHVNGTPDKDLIGTSVVNSLKQEFPEKKIVVVTNFPEIWLHNPDVFRVYRLGATQYFYEDYIENKDTKVFASDPYLTDDFIYKKKHVAEIWCEMIGIKYNNSLPKFYLTQREEEVAKRLTKTDKPIFLIQANEMFSPFKNLPTSWVKDIPIDVVQKISNKMKSAGYEVLQIRNSNQPGIVGATTVTLNLRLQLALILNTEKRLFIDSYMQHAATALNKPSVVTWMTSHPKSKGWNLHKNIHANINTELKEVVDSYSPIFDINGVIAGQQINTSEAYPVDEIINELEK